MTRSDGRPKWHRQAMHGLHARLSVLAQPARGFVSQPEPRSIGSFARGRQLCAGNFLFSGVLLEGPDTAIWELPATDPAFIAEMHGFAWLDDLAAVGDATARDRAQAWVYGWIARYGGGAGPGWVPELAGRRVIRWINHAVFLLNGRSPADSAAYFRSLGRQTRFLSRRWRQTAPGLPRFEALCGLVYAGLALTGLEGTVAPAIAALARECRLAIGADGGIETRNPEELLEIFTLLIWTSGALSESGRAPHPDHAAAIEHIGPVLRALRHADGGLARFHGGGRGAEGRLDQALAGAGGKALTAHGLAMGFARMAAGRTTIIVDAAPPPAGRASVNAHASTLAMELTSGRRPLIVSCGSGAGFGPEWRRAARATASHSALAVHGFSSARLAADGRTLPGLHDHLTDAPDDVWAQQESDIDGIRLMCGHNGYVATHGLTHVRQLSLSFDGRHVQGEDTLGAMSAADRRRFERVMERTRHQGVAFDIRFHLHPDVDAAVDLGGRAVSLMLRTGEIWVLRHDDVAELALAPSFYLESGRLRPRPARQIVLTSRVVDYACQIRWTLAKAQDTSAAVAGSDAAETD